AADAGASVLVLAKASHTSSNSYAAQGGIAAAVDPDDDPALHVADTLAAGRGLCRHSAVELLAAAAPGRIDELRRLGVRFDEGLGREGGHSLPRAHDAGAALADLELVQFHPTALRDGNGHDGFLLSEALRGAGATLLDGAGERFVDELAPRDVVARAIDARAGAHLDLRPVERDRYPTLMATLERAGYD